MTRREAVAAILDRKARAMGAHDYADLARRVALHELDHGESAHRAIRAGVAVAGACVDGVRDER